MKRGMWWLLRKHSNLLMWKGYAHYQNGDLEAAAEAYSQDPSASGFYNLGYRLF